MQRAQAAELETWPAETTASLNSFPPGTLEERRAVADVEQALIETVMRGRVEHLDLNSLGIYRPEAQTARLAKTWTQLKRLALAVVRSKLGAVPAVAVEQKAELDGKQSDIQAEPPVCLTEQQLDQFEATCELLATNKFRARAHSYSTMDGRIVPELLRLHSEAFDFIRSRSAQPIVVLDGKLAKHHRSLHFFVVCAILPSGNVAYWKLFNDPYF